MYLKFVSILEIALLGSNKKRMKGNFLEPLENLRVDVEKVLLLFLIAAYLIYSCSFGVRVCLCCLSLILFSFGFTLDEHNKYSVRNIEYEDHYMEFVVSRDNVFGNNMINGFLSGRYMEIFFKPTTITYYYLFRIFRKRNYCFQSYGNR